MAGHRMMNFARRFLPKAEKHWLLACDVLSLPSEFAVEGIDVITVTAGEQVRIELLETFATQNGFPAGWVRGMLDDQAEAVFARDESSNRILAMGWTTTNPFHIEEIGATLNPAGAVYFFGDFVTPAQRGRKLQRLLVAERLARMNDITRACTIIHPENGASMRSYQSEKFVTAGEFVRYRWCGRRWAACKEVGNVSGTRFAIDSRGAVVARERKG